MAMTLERAISIAATAHAGQFDKAGASYILHPLRVMLAQKSDAARIVAVLHDLLEDCPEWTPERLRDEGCSADILAALEALTKRPGEAYDVFVQRCTENALARAVKIADVRDNMDVSRLASLAEDDRQRLQKYERALAVLVPKGG